MSAPLDAAALPLGGVHLIEASAGTGKTFTLANLVLRLLIDPRDDTPCTVEQILVVTFTNAATEELRARIRDRVKQALDVLDGVAEPDASLDAILAPHTTNSETRACLELAYQCMDQASIFTIHGFCERVLRELAFESGELFDAALQADDDVTVKLAAEQWWRQTVTPLTREKVESIPSRWRSPMGLSKRLSKVLNDPVARIVPEVTDTDLERAARAHVTAFESFQTAWARSGEEWIAALREASAAKRISGAKDKYTDANLDVALREAERVACAASAPSAVGSMLALLGSVRVNSAALRKHEPPSHSLGDDVDALCGAVERAQHLWLARLQHSAQTEITVDVLQRKRAARERTFDDLLTQVHRALHSEAGDSLTATLRARYPFALIDEFQDTDRIQHGIFDRLYPRESSDTFGALYLIGDPKQSIYRFRGADIDVYLRARENTDAQHHLTVNWRSATRLINAINTLYVASPAPFGDVDIHYQPVTGAGRADASALHVAGEAVPPLQFDTIDLVEEKFPGIGASRDALATACARRVVWLLGDGEASLGETPLCAADIAVLVRTHSEAELVRAALAERGVGSAVRSPESVGKSPEARDLLALLRVLAEPGDTRSLARVLVSPLVGLAASDLVRLRDDPVAWQGIEDRIEHCRRQLHQAGPLAAVLRCMALFETRVRALGSASGQARGLERVLGNLLHLAELLQEEWQARPDARAMLRTLKTWIDGEGAGDRLQLRLESDDALVQIVTQHKSKGLQYPVVLLPFVGVGQDPARRGHDVVAYNEDGQPRLDVGSEDFAQRLQEFLAAEEAENLRLLYVALTRAEHGCWIALTANKNAWSAALIQLLGLAVDKQAKAPDLQLLLDEALASLATGGKDIAVGAALVDEPATLASSGDGATPVAALSSQRLLTSSWRVGSYSALARGATHAAERPDHDAVDAPAAVDGPPNFTNPFDFPRGAGPGTLIHAVFEELDFNAPLGATADRLIERQLRTHGVSADWAPALRNLVRNTLETRLPLCEMPLSALERRNRLDELGFHFPVASLEVESLCDTLRDAGVFGAEDTLQFDTLRGYMTGFIDLVFRHQGRWYIVDYKSNHLGQNPQDYAPDALAHAMRSHRYDLQYAIYAVALCRYLRNRDPNFNPATDFGGVLYLFVRGLSGDPADSTHNGVYAAQPTTDLIERLDALFDGAPAHA